MWVLLPATVRAGWLPPVQRLARKLLSAGHLRGKWRIARALGRGATKCDMVRQSSLVA